LIQRELEPLKVTEEKRINTVNEEEKLKAKGDELKTELEKLLTEAKDKLNEESQFLLETMLEIQVEIAGLESNRRTQGRLNKLKSLLTNKGINVESICQKQEEVIKLEKILEWLEPSQSESQVFQSQIEIPSK